MDDVTLCDRGSADSCVFLIAPNHHFPDVCIVLLESIFILFTAKKFNHRSFVWRDVFFAIYELQPINPSAKKELQ